jgi:hypothetical protein
MKLKFTIVFILSGLFIIGCKTIHKSKLSLFSNEKNIDIVIKSSCKLSAVSHLKEDSVFKKAIDLESDKSLQVLQIKSKTKLEKSNYKISKTEFIITERCSAKTNDGNPFIGLQENIYLENTKTNEILTFHADTIFIQGQSLSSPKTLVPRKLDFTSYIKPLTNKNYSQIKKYFK